MCVYVRGGVVLQWPCDEYLSVPVLSTSQGYVRTYVVGGVLCWISYVCTYVTCVHMAASCGMASSSLWASV